MSDASLLMERLAKAKAERDHRDFPWIERMLAANAWAQSWRDDFFLSEWMGQESEFGESDEEGITWTSTTATGHHCVELKDGYKDARKRACLDRARAGHRVWNTWAETMADVRKELVDTKLWGRSGVAANTRLTAVYDALATADFRDAALSADTTFTKFLFPGSAHFTGAAFEAAQSVGMTTSTLDEIRGDPDFTDASFMDGAYFSSCTFHGTAVFARVSFSEHATFARAQFAGGGAFFTDAYFDRKANFNEAKFSGGAFFEKATFHHGANFADVTFEGRTYFLAAHFGDRGHSAEVQFKNSAEVQFEDAKFRDQADFRAAKFNGDVVFTGATFTKRASFEVVSDWMELRLSGGDGITEFRGKVDLTEVTFARSVSFAGAVFSKEATFRSMDSRIDFSLSEAKFRQVPSFIGAEFRGMLHLDNVVTPKYPLFGWTSQRDAPERFRELKRRATEAKDHDRELEFFAQEVRTSRFHARGLPAFVPRVWEWRFWFGLFFGTFSDFGRSLWRPFLAWSVLFLGFAVFYLGQHEEMRKARAGLDPAGRWSTLVAYAKTTYAALENPPACLVQDRESFASTQAVTEAIQLSLRNGLVFQFGRIDSARRTLGCLFGFESAGEHPKVPPHVAFWASMQGLASAILIFLFLLAVRNLLRLK